MKHEGSCAKEVCLLLRRDLGESFDILKDHLRRVKSGVQSIVRLLLYLQQLAKVHGIAAVEPDLMATKISAFS